MRPIRGIWLLCLLMLSVTGKGQPLNDTIDRLSPDFVSASVIIAEPGEVLYSVLGHACLHLQCPAYELDYIFSYESEDARKKVLRFLTGDLLMGMARFCPDDFLQSYRKAERGMQEYVLHLPPEVKTELWRICDEEVALGMVQEYDPVQRGCAIAIIHEVENAVLAANERYGMHYHINYPEWGAPFDRTMREIFYDNAPHGWGSFWCMTFAGGVADNSHLSHKEKLICPRELVDVWQHSTIDGTPLLGSPESLLSFDEKHAAVVWTPLVCSLIMLLLASIGLFWRRSYIDWLVLALQTILGCLVVWMWLMPLPATGFTWLVVPFNPLPVICWKWRDKWAKWYVLVVVLWCIGMLCAPHRLVEPAHVIFAVSFGMVLFKQTPIFTKNICVFRRKVVSLRPICRTKAI